MAEPALPASPQDLVLRFLASIGRPAEAEQAGAHARGVAVSGRVGLCDVASGKSLIRSIGSSSSRFTVP